MPHQFHTYICAHLTAVLQHMDGSEGLDKDLGKKVEARLRRFSTFSLFKQLSLEVTCARAQCTMASCGGEES